MIRPLKNAETERRLREAAVGVFSARGFDAASMDEIAAAAGLSKGALYYRYATKDELVDDVVDRAARDRAARIAAVTVSGAAGPATRAQQATGHLVAALGGDDDWAALLPQCAARAGRDDAFAARLAGHLEEIRAQVVRVLEQRAAELALPLPLPAEDLAAMLTGLAGGLALETRALPGPRRQERLGAATALLLSGAAIASRARARTG
jgi:AcrR family transcriptional regulator